MLLLPGLHKGPLVLAADKVVHVFGRGRATMLWAAPGSAVASEAAVATIDGLLMRRVGEVGQGYGVLIRGGALRLQACDVMGPHAVEGQSAGASVSFRDGADPILLACRRVCGRA